MGVRRDAIMHLGKGDGFGFRLGLAVMDGEGLGSPTARMGRPVAQPVRLSTDDRGDIPHGQLHLAFLNSINYQLIQLHRL
jgi:hypothetical protein